MYNSFIIPFPLFIDIIIPPLLPFIPPLLLPIPPTNGGGDIMGAAAAVVGGDMAVTLGWIVLWIDIVHMPWLVGE